MIDLVIAGTFTIAGAVLGGAVSKYGFPSLNRGHKLVMAGVGSPLEDRTNKCEIESIQFKSFVVQWGSRRSTFKANCVLKTRSQDELICTITGEANKSHPRHKAVFYTEATVNHKSDTFAARGIALLDISPPGFIYGELVQESILGGAGYGAFEHFGLSLDRWVSE